MAQTTGPIQRLKWVSGIRDLFAYIGPSLGASELLFVSFNDPSNARRASSRAMAVTLARAQGAALPVIVGHADNGAAITSVDLRAPAVRVSSIEITQAIQDPGQSVPLIAAKRTVVRVYLESAATGLLSVTGNLLVRRPGEADRSVAASASVVLDPADFGLPANLRASAAKSLNFVLPADAITPGSVNVSLQSLADAGGVPVPYLGAEVTQTAVLASAPPLRITVVGFTYSSGNPPQTFTPSQADFDLLFSWLRRAYPVADLVASRRVVTATSAPQFTCGQINTELAQIRALDVSGGTDARTHYYGLVADGGFFMRGCAGVPSSPNPAAVGSGPTGSASWGWDTDGSYGDWYGGHEIGHTFGRRHPGFCGETHDDATYPFILGQLADVDGSFAGFDVGDMALGLGLAAMPGTAWHDVMTYCPTEWLSSYTYDGIKARLAAEDALSPGAAPGGGRDDQRYPDRMTGGERERAAAAAPRVGRRALVSLVASLSLARSTGRITLVHPVERVQPTAEDPHSLVQLRVLDRDERVLATHSLPVQRFADVPESADIDAIADAVLPIDRAATALELYVDQQLVDTYRVSGLPGDIQDLRAIREADGALAVSWTPLARGAGEAAYSVQVSQDRGRTWETVAIGVEAGSTRIHSSNIRNEGDVLVRVLASNGIGMNSSVAESRPDDRTHWAPPRSEIERNPLDRA
jgi:hypothetical protein